VVTKVTKVTLGGETMNLDQIEQQLNDQAADLRATDARLTALEADARLDAQLERLLAEMEAEAGAGTP